MTKQTGIFYRWAVPLLVGIISFHFFHGTLPALEPDAPVEQYLVDQWEKANGIPSNTILSIAQTPDGYLWIATSKGLVRFDGMKFSTLRFAEKEVVEPLENTIPDFLMVDKGGTLWIGSSAGLTSYRYESGEFKTYTDADGITNDRVRRMKEDMRGNLWISSFSGYTDRFTNGTTTKFNASHGLGGKRINGIVEARNGDLLFGTRENGVFVYRDGSFSSYPVPGLGNAQINHMHEDRKGDIWIGTNQGLFHISENETRVYTEKEGLSDSYITYITDDSDRNTWAGTRKGVNRIRRNQDNTVDIKSTLESVTVISIFEDMEKSLWVGTYDSGLKRLKDGKFISYSPYAVNDEYRDAMLFSIFEDRDGDTWIGALGGKLFRCRGDDFIEAVDIPAAAGAAVTAVTQDPDGNLWLGTNGKGVLQKKNGTFVQFTTDNGLADNLVTSLFVDSRGDLWLSTFDGVSRYRDGRIDSFKTKDGVSGKRVSNVYEDKYKNLWIAADKGITVLKDGNPSKENANYFLPEVSVSCIYEDPSTPEGGDPVFWIATHGAGLKRLKGLKNPSITSFTTADGMTTNFIYQFFEDKQENFWLMSDSGILRVGKAELNRFADEGLSDGDKINCTSFGLSDGMQSTEFENEFSRHSAIKTGSGEFRFITKKGISIVNPANVHINKVPPPVVVEALSCDDQLIFHHHEAGAEGEGEYVFKGVVDFRFHFTAPTFLSPEKVKFKYKLGGFDRQWVFLPPEAERVAHYRDLEPGTYTFTVIAGNSEGVWNRTGDSVTFTLKPFFHQTLFFKIIIFLMVIALAAGGFYLYKKLPLKKQEKYKGSALNQQFADECIKKLRFLMEIKKEYREPEISLQSLAEKLSITSHQLSQILNEKLNRNFSDFINYYRIEEAKAILLKPESDQQKITTVAFDVGFNTTVAFYNAFKKYTNMTPSQFKKNEKGEKNGE